MWDNISKKDMKLSKEVDSPYIRVLGFNDNGKKLISKIQSSYSIDIRESKNKRSLAKRDYV